MEYFPTCLKTTDIHWRTEMLYPSYYLLYDKFTFQNSFEVFQSNYTKIKLLVGHPAIILITTSKYMEDFKTFKRLYYNSNLSNSFSLIFMNLFILFLISCFVFKVVSTQNQYQCQHQ